MITRILAISGSLRASSVNTAVLRASMMVVPNDVTITLYDGLGELPHFNPDLDGEASPISVSNFRRQLNEADGVLVCCPEYAHGVPGAFKNALDWIVSSGEFMHKPVALIHARPAPWAEASLTETLTVMMAKLVPEASITLPLHNNSMDEFAIVSTPDLFNRLTSALHGFVEMIRREAKPGHPNLHLST